MFSKLAGLALLVLALLSELHGLHALALPGVHLGAPALPPRGARLGVAMLESGPSATSVRLLAGDCSLLSPFKLPSGESEHFN